MSNFVKNYDSFQSPLIDISIIPSKPSRQNIYIASFIKKWLSVFYSGKPLYGDGSRIWVPVDYTLLNVFIHKVVRKLNVATSGVERNDSSYMINFSLVYLYNMQ